MGQLECVIIVIIYNHTENKFQTVQLYNRSINFDILEICTKWINKTVIDFKELGVRQIFTHAIKEIKTKDIKEVK